MQPISESPVMPSSRTLRSSAWLGSCEVSSHLITRERSTSFNCISRNSPLEHCSIKFNSARSPLLTPTCRTSLRSGVPSADSEPKPTAGPNFVSLIKSPSISEEPSGGILDEGPLPNRWNPLLPRPACNWRTLTHRVEFFPLHMMHRQRKYIVHISLESLPPSTGHASSFRQYTLHREDYSSPVQRCSSCTLPSPVFWTTCLHCNASCHCDVWWYMQIGSMSPANVTAVPIFA